MWDKSPSLFADVVERAAVKRVKDVSTDMLTALVDLAPVDTSNYVGNMTVSLDAPNWTYVEGKTIGRGGAMANGMGVINSMPVDKLHSVFLSSTVPYAKYLERGHSRFAPNGVFTVAFLGVATWYR